MVYDINSIVVCFTKKTYLALYSNFDDDGLKVKVNWCNNYILRCNLSQHMTPTKLFFDKYYLNITCSQAKQPL